VALVPGGNPPLELTGGPLLKATNVFEGTIGYLRVSRVEEGLAKAVREAYRGLETNKPNGLVLDLRFTGGEDYEAAADAADLFLSKERSLLDWGAGLARSKTKRDAITIPLAVLVNDQTARAAEALAAVLRETSVALLLGRKTSGQALITQEYPLKNGQRLRIATASIQVGEGVLLTSQGVKPDILVEVSAADERAYFADAYKDPARTNPPPSGSFSSSQQDGTNRLRRARLNEAELVRERRDGILGEMETATIRAEADAERVTVRDPVLARALDLLKGLALVRQSRS
ncbi:MAG TPA: S41 family peptidase, partial [Verrucomicrobiae bacterium]